MIPESLSRHLAPGTDNDVATGYARLPDVAVDAVFGFEEQVAIVDIETTGFDLERDSIIEIAAAVLDGPNVVSRFNTFVDPGRPLPVEITRLTGIDEQMLAGAPIAEDAVERLAEFIDGRPIVAHHVAFDRGFLTSVAGRGGFRGPWLCSLELARIALPRLKSHRLIDLASALGAPTPSHRAADDVEALAFVWRALLAGLHDLEPGVLKRLVALAPETEWPLRSVLAHHAAALQPTAFDLAAMRGQRVSGRRTEPLEDADDVACECPDIAAVLGEFTAGGIAGRMYDGFEPRSEQTRMAEAVLQAFDTRTHLALEAGTGVGKSVAYLLPSALFALKNGVGVGVATKTNSLTDQLVHSELPALAAALDEELRYVALKGYDHYPCLRKVEQLAAEQELPTSEAVAAVAAIIAWVSQSSWGDLDSLNIHLDRGLRGAIAASQADCTRKRCRFYPYLCFLHGVRRRASSAHIVVTNHALLFRDVTSGGTVLPALRHWVIDEAHAVEEEARKQLSLAVSHAELEVVLGALRTSGGGLLGTIRRRFTRARDDSAPVTDIIARMERACDKASTLVGSFFDFVKDLDTAMPDTSYDERTARLTAEIRESGPWGTIAGVGRSLARTLEGIIADGRDLVTALEEAGPEYADPKADLSGLLSRIADQHVALVVVLDGEADEFVYSATFDRRRSSNRDILRASMLDIGEALAAEFYPRVGSTVFCSATIATGEDFSHFEHAVGLDRLEPQRWRTLRLDSSYDFDDQMAVFVANDMPEPGAGGYLEALAEMLERVHVAMGGSTLTLFTNRRDMEAVYSRLAPALEERGISLLAQLRGVSAKRLRDEFIADETLSLFALKSFWEGFDAKGDTLRCVVVPKLPFGQFTDPLHEERRERDPQAWKRYYLPEAILGLKQAAGRLIRSRTDTGCLIIADARVAGGKRYGRDFLAVLPVKDVEILGTSEIIERIEERFSRAPDRP